MLCITNQINLLNKLNEMNKQMTLNLNMIFNQSYSKLNKELIQINSSSSFAGSNEFVMNLLYMKTQLEQVKQSLHFNESSSVIIGKIIQSITDKHTNEKLICSNKESLINRVCNQSVGNNSVINSDTMVKHLNINKQNTLSNYLDNILDIFVEYPKVNLGKN